MAVRFSSNFLQPDLGAIEFVDHAFVHRIHESTDAGGLGGTLLSDFDPNVRECCTETGIIVDLVDGLMQPSAGLDDLKLHSHGHIPSGFCDRSLYSLLAIFTDNGYVKSANAGSLGFDFDQASKKFLGYPVT